MLACLPLYCLPLYFMLLSEHITDLACNFWIAYPASIGRSMMDQSSRNDHGVLQHFRQETDEAYIHSTNHMAIVLCPTASNTRHKVVIRSGSPRSRLVHVEKEFRWNSAFGETYLIERLRARTHLSHLSSLRTPPRREV